MANQEIENPYQKILDSFEDFKKRHNFSTNQEVTSRIFPDKNDRYLTNGLYELKHQKKGASSFAEILEKTMNTYDENPDGILVSDHSFFIKMNQRQNTPFTADELNGLLGKYLMITVHRNHNGQDNPVISSFEVFKNRPATTYSYDSIVFFTSKRSSKEHGVDERQKIREITINGFIVKSGRESLMCHARVHYEGAPLLKSCIINGFHEPFNKNKIGIWIGNSIIHNQRIYVSEVVLVKIIGEELEKEFEQNLEDIIGFHDEDELRKNKLVMDILHEADPNSKDALGDILVTTTGGSKVLDEF